MNSITVPDVQTIKLTRTGIVFNGQPTLDEWLNAFSGLWEAQEAIRWCLGDMIIHAEKQTDWGEMYTQALEETPFAYSTLTQYVRVCRSFPYERRRPDVKWTHYQKLASLPELQQERLLDQIESGEIFSTDQTAEMVKKEQKKGNEREDKLPPIEPDMIYPPCPLCGWPLELHRNRCNNCSGTVNEMAYRYRDLRTAVSALYETGERGLLDTFVSAYINSETQ